MGTAILGKHFPDSQHCAIYSVCAKTDTVLIRYMASEDTEAILAMLPKADGFSTVAVKFEKTDVTEIAIHPTGKPITLDCLVVGDEITKIVEQQFFLGK